MVTSIDHGAWKARFDEASAQIQERARAVWQALERDPARLRRLQNASHCAAGLVVAIKRRAAGLGPLSGRGYRDGTRFGTEPAHINHAGRDGAIIDTSSVLGTNLFGSAPDGAVDAFDSFANNENRDGIERNANETRLALTLTGIAASTDDGRGSAVIKSGTTEQVFSVGDALPASGQVVLAKVMPQQVVIDNNGTYELIKLYDGPGIAVPARPVTRPASASPTSTAASMSGPEAVKASASERSALAGAVSPTSSMTTLNPLPKWCLCRRCGKIDRIVGYRIAPWGGSGCLRCVWTAAWRYCDRGEWSRA